MAYIFTCPPLAGFCNGIIFSLVRCFRHLLGIVRGRLSQQLPLFNPNWQRVQSIRLPLHKFLTPLLTLASPCLLFFLGLVLCLKRFLKGLFSFDTCLAFAFIKDKIAEDQF